MVLFAGTRTVKAIQVHQNGTRGAARSRDLHQRPGSSATSDPSCDNALIKSLARSATKVARRSLLVALFREPERPRAIWYTLEQKLEKGRLISVASSARASADSSRRLTRIQSQDSVAERDKIPRHLLRVVRRSVTLADYNCCNPVPDQSGEHTPKPAVIAPLAFSAGTAPSSSSARHNNLIASCCQGMYGAPISPSRSAVVAGSRPSPV